MRAIKSCNQLAPSGHYAQAIHHGESIYLSAQLPIDPISGDKLYGSFEDETRVILQNLESTLAAVNGNRGHILKTTVFMTDITHWSTVDHVYAMFFGSHQPARSVVEVGKLHFGFKVAIEAVAAVPSDIRMPEAHGSL